MDLLTFCPLAGRVGSPARTTGARVSNEASASANGPCWALTALALAAAGDLWALLSPAAPAPRAPVRRAALMSCAAWVHQVVPVPWARRELMGRYLQRCVKTAGRRGDDDNKETVLHDRHHTNVLCRYIAPGIASDKTPFEPMSPDSATPFCPLCLANGAVRC